MIRILYILLFQTSTAVFYSQELFVHSEPASNVPAKVLTVRFSNELYKENCTVRTWQGYKFMYGFNSKWMLIQTFSFSNHHSPKLPAQFIQYDPAQNFYYTSGSPKGLSHPYSAENLCLTIKYRFLSLDKEKQHFRMAAYADLAGGNEAHYEAEPGYSGDNSGVGLGIITTILKNKFASSINLGFQKPNRYKQYNPDVTIQYGNALSYIISTGYLMYPKRYKSYKQTNINFYLELFGKIYQTPTIQYHGQNISIYNAPTLTGSSYLEIRPSLQFIIHSNTRIDIGISKSIIRTSFIRSDPTFFLNIQRSIYL